MPDFAPKVRKLIAGSGVPNFTVSADAIQRVVNDGMAECVVCEDGVDSRPRVLCCVCVCVQWRCRGGCSVCEMVRVAKSRAVRCTR